MGQSKQDRQSVRTAAELAQRYNFKQSFSAVAGYANEARRAAEQAESAAQSISRLFAGDIVMTGKLTNTVETYLLPGEEEIATMQNHFAGIEEIPAERIPLYDFNNDGIVSTLDIMLAIGYRQGTEDFSQWSGAVKSVVTMTIDLTDPSKAIRFSGLNMWGRAVESYLGIDFTTAVNQKTEDKISDVDNRLAFLEDRVAALEQGG